MEFGGIMPQSEVSELFYGGRVGTKGSVNGWDIPFCPSLVAPEPAGVLKTNGDGDSGIFEADGGC